jgi:hypothetical protein
VSIFTIYIFVLHTFAIYIEEDETGGTCSTNGVENERVQVVGGKARGKEATRKTKT